MSEQDWAPEPWELETKRIPCELNDGFDRSYIFAEDKRWVLSNSIIDHMPELSRIVACVNACAGVPTPVLERQGITVKPPKDPFYPEEAPHD